MSFAKHNTRTLIFVGAFEPAEKAGGPIRSVVNLIAQLKHVFRFFIVTSDRDLGDKSPFSSVNLETWNKDGQVQKYYTDKKRIIFNLHKILAEIKFDSVYLNSFFSLSFTTIPLIYLLVWRGKNTHIVLAPRGEFSKGALSLKWFKKYIYIKVFKLLGINNRITWHATTDYETKDIQNVFGVKEKIIVAPNLVNIESGKSIKRPQIIKKAGELKICFISRIVEKKNLLFALNVLLKYQYKGNIVFDIYGPIEDLSYWSQCEEKISHFPPNISVRYLGVIKHNDVKLTFKAYHLFLFPTLGENFGHVIVESLLSGCPVLMSDQVPWTSINKEGGGWCIPLGEEYLFHKVIDKLLRTDSSKYLPIRKKALHYINKYLIKQDLLNKYKSLFNYRSLI